MKLFLSLLSPFYLGTTPGKGAVISLSGVIWFVRPSQAAACDSDIYQVKKTAKSLGVIIELLPKLTGEQSEIGI